MSAQPGELAQCDQLYQEAKVAVEEVAAAVRAKSYQSPSETYVRLVAAMAGVPSDVPTLNKMFAATLVQLLEKEQAA